MSGLLSVETLIAEVRGRGMDFKRNPDGTAALTGATANVTPALLAVLKRRRSEVTAALWPGGAPARRREFRWPGGMTCFEAPEYAAEDAGEFPGLAVEWRHEGEQVWRRIERTAAP